MGRIFERFQERQARAGWMALFLSPPTAPASPKAVTQPLLSLEVTPPPSPREATPPASPKAVTPPASPKAVTRPSPPLEITSSDLLDLLPRSSPKASKPVVEAHACQAVSWYDPSGATWEPHSDPLIPLDRRHCGKKATIKVSVNGEEVWCCGTHAKDTPETCPTCAKNKHVDFDGTHKHRYLKTGYVLNGSFVEGECQGLLREGASKLAKKGLERWSK